MEVLPVDFGTNRPAIVVMDRDLLGGPETQELRTIVSDLASKGNRNLVLDFIGCPHINSMGLGVLTSAYITYTKLGGSIALCNCGPNVRVLLGLTKVGSLFEICGSREEAIRLFSR